MDYLGLTVAGSAIFTVLAGLTITWTKSVWWISEQFAKTREELTLEIEVQEAKNQKRHEDNIERFAVLETKINTVLRNGHKH